MTLRNAAPLVVLLIGVLVLVVRGEDPDRPEQQARKEDPRTSSAVERTSPSVVRIELTAGKPRGDAARWRLHRRVASRRAAAGFVVGERLVVTHAVLALYDRPRYKVTTTLGDRIEARLVRLDREREIAVLRTNAPLGVAPVDFGSSRELRPGNLVIALGDPFGLAKDARATATFGVLEGRTRLQALESSYKGEVLLTCASVNPGSEGGPLIDLSGRVVGLLAPLAQDQRVRPPAFGPSEPSLSGYAIPVEELRVVLAEVSRRPVRLGLTGRPDDQGVQVVRVESGGLAQRAGIRPGDVIRRIAGIKIRSSADLRRSLALNPGKTVKVRVERSGELRELNLSIPEGEE